MHGMHLSASRAAVILRLARLVQCDSPRLRRVGQELQDLLAPPPETRFDADRYRLWMVDDEDNAIPWRVPPTYRFTCNTLTCKDMTAKECVRRQVVSETQHTRDTWRGQGSQYPSCVTEKCLQGQVVRAALDPTTDVKFRGEGPGHRFERKRSDLAEQEAARRRQYEQGLLEEQLTIDYEPPVEE